MTKQPQSNEVLLVDLATGEEQVFADIFALADHGVPEGMRALKDISHEELYAEIKRLRRIAELPKAYEALLDELVNMLQIYGHPDEELVTTCRHAAIHAGGLTDLEEKAAYLPELLEAARAIVDAYGHPDEGHAIQFQAVIERAEKWAPKE